MDSESMSDSPVLKNLLPSEARCENFSRSAAAIRRTRPWYWVSRFRDTLPSSELEARFQPSLEGDSCPYGISIAIDVKYSD